MTLGLAWALRWVLLVVVVASALLLYMFPTRFSGPVTDRERDDDSRGTFWAHVTRYGTPICAIVGLALLLPARGCPDAIEYTSLTAGGPDGSLDPDDPSARFACVVEAVLTRATKLADGRAPGREQLRQAIADNGLDPDCRNVTPVENPPDAALIESLEITLIMLHAQAGRLRSVSVRPGPLYSDFDAWAVAAPVLDHWTDFDIDLHSRKSADIYRLDRARVSGSSVMVWALASEGALCREPPVASLVIDALARRCVLDPASVAELCSTRAAGMVAAFAKLDCEAGPLSAPDRPESRARLQWGSAPEIPVLWPGRVSVRVEGDAELWTEAVALARLDERESSFASELRGWGHELPEIDATSRVTLDLSGEDHIEIRSGGSCSGTGTAGDLALPSGPFSFEGLRHDGQSTVRLHEGCVRIAVPPAALRRPTHTIEDVYEATRFYATMGAITWAASCVEAGCRAQPPIEPAGGRAYPLLSRAEIDELLGATVWRDPLGLMMMALSLCLMMLRYLWNTDAR